KQDLPRTVHLHGQFGPFDPGRRPAQWAGPGALPRLVGRQPAQGRSPPAGAGHAPAAGPAGRWLPQQELGRVRHAGRAAVRFHLHGVRQRRRRSLPHLAGQAHDRALGRARPGRRHGHAGRTPEGLPGRRPGAQAPHRTVPRAAVRPPRRHVAAAAVARHRQGLRRAMADGSRAMARPAGAMSLFERYLSLWVVLCIVAGVLLGQAAPALFQSIARLEIARVNLPVGLLIWIMIIPMLMKVDFGALGQVRRHWRGIGVTLFVNWAVKPFSMALLGWLFIRHVFAPWLPAAQLDSYIAGLILLAAAPCTAMVFVWSRLTGGDPAFTLSQVALNDTIMVFAFAPIVGLLLGISAIAVPWDTLLASVALYIVIPVALAQAWRRALLRRGPAAFERIMARIGPASMAALLLTLVLLFAFQGRAILQQPLVIAMLAVPILIQVLFNAGLAYWLNRRAGEQHSVACPSALIGASNFFELSVAAAISLFGFESGAALATVVGVLIEVPVMLLVVRVVNRTRGWYESAAS